MSDTKVKGEAIGRWVAQLAAGDTSWVEKLYLENREAFLIWGGSRYNLEKDDLLDIYQTAMIVLYENIRHNRIQNMQVSVTTYLYGIAKNLIAKYHRKNELIRRHQVRLGEHYSFIATTTNELESYAQRLHRALATMSEPCKSILRLFYIRGLKLATIAQKMDYPNVDVVKTQKSRCLKKLKEIVS